MSRRVFNTYHASEEEIRGVRAALDDAGISHFETYRGWLGLGSAAIWVRDDIDHDRAREVIEAFQREWSEGVRKSAPVRGINWAAVPALLIVIVAVGFLTFYWYFHE